MVCERCEAAGKRSENVFIGTERLFILGSAVSMMRSIKAGGKAQTEDELVANSVITKMLLSLPVQQRNVLTEHFKKTLGIDITLGDCLHKLSSVFK
jgi:hypothetical protein